MDLTEKRARWSRMLVQAEHFAELENTIDALARAKLCLKEVEAELAEGPLGEERATLEKERARAKRRVETYAKLHAEWTARTGERARQFVANEQRRYDEPLPKKGLD